MDQRHRQQKHSIKDDDDDDRRFLKQFAAQIGAVLREQEEAEEEERSQREPRTKSSSSSSSSRSRLLSQSQSQSQSPKTQSQKTQMQSSTSVASSSSNDDDTTRVIDEYVYDLYKSLVYDEPIIDRRIMSERNNLLQVVASALGRQLLLLLSESKPPNSSSVSLYALSNRFVNGLLYMCRRSQSQSSSSTTKTSSRTKRDDDDDDNDFIDGKEKNDQDEEQQQKQSMSLLLGGNNDDGSSSSSSSSSSQTTRYIMSKLAFVAFVEVPLQCCQLSTTTTITTTSNNNNNDKEMMMIDTIRRYLGSYKGTSSAHDISATATSATTSNGNSSAMMMNELELQLQLERENTATETNAQVQQQQQQQQQDVADEQKGEVTKEEEDEAEKPFDEEEEEVWAAESDPSDYDYGAGEDDNDGGEGNNNFMSSLWPGMAVNDNDDGGDWFLDPKSLSRPDPELDVTKATEAISSLLHHANYNIFEPIFVSEQSRQNETLHVVNCLKEFVVLMLLSTSSSSTTSPSSSIVQLLKEHGKDHAILSPLWILRDAAIYQPQQYSSHYLEILQMLLAAQDQGSSQTEDETTTKTTTTTTSLLSTSSIVGLSSLSSWCLQQGQQGSNKTNRNVTTVTVNAIVESMNDMSLIVEQALQPPPPPTPSSQSQPGDNDNNNTKMKLSLTLVPILECLSGIWYNQWGPVPTSRTPVAQTLLNSGFLRQILVLATTPVVADSQDTTGSSKSLQQQPLHHALWGLCVAYPKVVGKYVFRYPGTAQLVRRYVIQNNSTAEECVESFLWNMFAWVQCSESNPAATSSTSKVAWKNGSTLKGKTSTPLTVDECSAVCEKAWACLCQLVEDSLNDLATTPTSDDKTKAVLDQWERLLAFVRIPMISMKCKSVIDSSHHIEKIVSTLSKLPKIEEDSENSKAKTIKFKEEDNVTNHDSESDEVIEGREKHSASNREVIHGQAHRLIKEYKTYIRGGSSASAKTD